MSAVAKRKRISKKRKEAWRKTDIQDVDDFLEEQRQQERIGTLTDKPDSELFTIDAAPHATQEPVLTERQKRKLNAKKPMRSHAELENTSKVQDPIVKRNHVKLKKSGRIIEEEVRNPTKPRHFQANKDRQRYYEQLEKKLKSKEEGPLKTVKDIWAETDFRDEIPGLKDEKGWISRDLALHVTKNVGKPVIKTHASLRHRTTKAKNFEPPHPGMSYNPSPENHLDLINKVVEVEEKIIKENKHLKRVTTQMFKKLTPEERTERYLKEMEGDVDEEEDENEKEKGKSTTDKKASKSKKKSKKIATEEDGKENAVVNNDADDVPYKSVNPPVEIKKKSKQAKRNELKQKELQTKKQKEKELKKQIADLNRIKSLKAEVLADEEKLNALKKRRKKVALQKKFEPKRLGRLKYVDPDIDVKMPEEISGSIRNITPESSLLVDRFKSFQKRNILPVSVATGKQKAKKIKRFPRSSHKEPGVSFQMLRDKRKAAAKSEKKLNIMK